jgi:ABC-type transport system involved in cytochrome c biogenesis ATPase subunit
MGVGNPYFPRGSDIIIKKAVAHSEQGKLEEVSGTQGAGKGFFVRLRTELLSRDRKRISHESAHS